MFQIWGRHGAPDQGVCGMQGLSDWSPQIPPAQNRSQGRVSLAARQAATADETTKGLMTRQQQQKQFFSVIVGNYSKYYWLKKGVHQMSI